MSDHEPPRGCTALISDGVHLFRCSIGTTDRCERHTEAEASR